MFVGHPCCLHIFDIVSKGTSFLESFCSIEITIESFLNIILASIDFVHSIGTSEKQLILLVLKVVENFLVVIDDLLVTGDEFLHIFTNGARQDQFTPQTVALIKFSAEPRQFTHYLYEVALRFSIFELDLFSFLIFLGKLLL